jgi:hypothetical protein
LLSSEPQFAPISFNTTGDHTLVVAQGTGVKIRVVEFLLVSAGSVTAVFQSGAAGTPLTGVMSLIVGVPADAGPGPWGLFETAANQLLNLSLGGNIQVSGQLVWVQAS